MLFIIPKWLDLVNLSSIAYIDLFLLYVNSCRYFSCIPAFFPPPPPSPLFQFTFISNIMKYGHHFSTYWCFRGITSWKSKNQMALLPWTTFLWCHFLFRLLFVLCLLGFLIPASWWFCNICVIKYKHFIY